MPGASCSTPCNIFLLPRVWKWGHHSILAVPRHRVIRLAWLP